MRWRSKIRTGFLLFVLAVSAIPLSLADDVRVLVCLSPNAVAFHAGYCSGMKRCSYGSRWVTLSEAQAMGRTPCGFCYKNKSINHENR